MKTIKIELEIPEGLLLSTNIPREHLPEEVKKLFCLELYREGRLSLGKACELAGITKWEFFEINKRANIPIHISEEDWEKDKETVSNLTP